MRPDSLTTSLSIKLPALAHFLRLHLVGKRITRAAAIEDNNVFGKVGTSGAEVQKALKGRTVVGAGNQGKYFWILLETSRRIWLCTSA